MIEHQLMCRRDLLQHSFYKRWVVGELSVDELRYYAGQYAYVVAALPGWLRRAAKGSPADAAPLTQHAAEEDGHIALWHSFARAVGVTDKEMETTVPNPATAELLRRGDELSATATGTAVAWALEVQAPAVSAEKLRGLEAYYQIGSSTGGDYFELHSTRDVAHADELDRMIAALEPDQQVAAQRAADAILDGLWDLLTSAEKAA